MKKYLLLLNLIFVVLFSSSSIVYSSNEEQETSKNHRSLPKDIPYMKPNIDPNPAKDYDYEVNDSIFNKIYLLQTFTSKLFNRSSCQLVSEKGGSGSGTVISIEKTSEARIRSKIFTARHVVETDDGDLSFPDVYQGLTSFKEEEERVAYLAKHKVDEICFNPKTKADIALLKGEVIDNPVDDFLYESVAKLRSRKDHSESNGYMNHYPLGVSTQRFNTGEVRKDGEHTISSLPGSSGAGIFNSHNRLSYIHSGGGDITRMRALYNLSILKDLPNRDKTFNISENNKSSPIFEEDLMDFCQCYKFSDWQKKK